MTRQYHLPLPRREAMGLDDFLPTQANALAVQWLFKTNPTEWPSHMLVLWGPQGSGKTHMLNIWCDLWGAQKISPEESVLENLVTDGQAAPAFALDGADDVSGDSEKEEWLQHFYNASKTAGKFVLLTAQRPPALWGLALKDITTRLKSAQTIRLEEPDDALMHGLLVKQFRDRQLLVDAPVVGYLAARLERTGTAVQRAVALLDEASLEGHRKISIPFAQKILGWKES